MSDFEEYNIGAYIASLKATIKAREAEIERLTRTVEVTEADALFRIARAVSRIGHVQGRGAEDCTGSSIRCCLCAGSYVDSSDEIRHSAGCAWVLARRLVAGTP